MKPADSPSCWGRPALTPSERRAKTVLEEIFEHGDFLILPGFKLSQVIYQRPTGTTYDQWNYATRAHFDFVVCDAKTFVPDFAIELDDPTHNALEAQQRDRKKDVVCEAAGFELLRITSSALDRGPRGRRLVEYLIDARQLGQAFYEAQEQGAIPLDEPYDYRLVLGRNDDGRVCLINDLSQPARLAALTAYEAGEIKAQIIKGFHLYWRDGWAEGWSWLHVRDDLFLFRQTKLRSYRFDCGIGPGELAEDLSAAAIGDDLAAMRRNEPVLCTRLQLRKKLVQLRRSCAQIERSYILDHIAF